MGYIRRQYSTHTSLSPRRATPIDRRSGADRGDAHERLFRRHRPAAVDVEASSEFLKAAADAKKSGDANFRGNTSKSMPEAENFAAGHLENVAGLEERVICNRG